MPIYVKESSTWREVNQPYVKSAGTWRTIITQSVNSVGTWRTVVFPDNGELWNWGSPGGGALGNNTTTGNRSTPLTTFAGGTNWKQVAGGYNHIAAITYIDSVL